MPPFVVAALSLLAIAIASFSLWRNDLRGARISVKVLMIPAHWTGAQVSAEIPGNGSVPAQVDPWLFHEHVKANDQLNVIAISKCSAQIVNDGPRGGSIWNFQGVVDSVPAPWIAEAYAVDPTEVRPMGPRSTSPLTINFTVTMKGRAIDLEPALAKLASSTARVRLTFRKIHGTFNRTADGNALVDIDFEGAAKSIAKLLEDNAKLLDPLAPDPPMHLGLPAWPPKRSKR